MPASHFEMPRVISGEELRDLVPMAVRAAFIGVSAGDYEQLPRASLSDGSLLTMVARKSGSAGSSVKILGIRQDATLHPSPMVNAAVLWFDHASGRPLALIDGAVLTAIRTGAASGVATDLMASHDATVLAMLGSGAQAGDQVLGVCSVRRIEIVRVFSRRFSAAQELCDRLHFELPTVEFVPCGDVHTAVRGAHVICTATPSHEPMVISEDLMQRVHINAMGAYRFEMCEVAADVIAAASIVAVDHLPASEAEAGDLLQAVAAGRFSMNDACEIGVLLSKESTDYFGWTIFKSVGIAAQDWAVASLAVGRMNGVEKQ
jgi:ornithine cyclodeaminase